MIKKRTGVIMFNDGYFNAESNRACKNVGGGGGGGMDGVTIILFIRESRAYVKGSLVISVSITLAISQF